jgi:hypothetical protein
MTVKEPRTGIIGLEADGDVVRRIYPTNVHDVTTDRVVVIVFLTVGATHNREGMLK